MLVIIRPTGQLMTGEQFCNALRTGEYKLDEEHGTTSIEPSMLTLETLNYFLADPVFESPQPTGEPWQYAIPDGVEYVTGVWWTKYKLGPEFASQEEQDAYVSNWNEQRRNLIKAQVDAERDRRMEAGFTFNGVFYQNRLQDQKRIAGAGTLALGAMVQGAQPGNLRWADPAADFVWIAADNSETPMDAQTVFAFGTAAAANEKRLVFAAKALKAMQDIPADFASNDDYWD